MPLRRRRPVLRAAAVGGGAYLMGKRHAEQTAQEGPAEEQATPAAAQPSASDGLSAEDMARLQQLAQLNKEGVLTDQELAEQKARILG